MTFRRHLAIALMFPILGMPLSLTKGQEHRRTRPTKSLGMTEEQHISHALSRLSFGARPGDVQRVKAIGLKRYIDQQLEPEKISDSLAEAKLSDLFTLSMSVSELYQEFPQPAQVLRHLQ